MDAGKSEAVPTQLKRRSFYPTPAWLVPGSLSMTGILFLAERWQWFSFSSHKGWSVLIAAAAVGVVMVLLSLWFLMALLFRWRFQFSIRTLLVLVVAVALPCSWLAAETKKADKQREAVEAIEKLDGLVTYDPNEESDSPFPEAKGPRFLRKLLGDDFFNDIDYASVDHDVQMEELKRFPRLHELMISGDDITDVGLSHISGLAQLRFLLLGGTSVTDAGLENLRSLDQLQELDLTDTHVTDAGVAKLQQALPNCTIYH